VPGEPGGHAAVGGTGLAGHRAAVRQVRGATGAGADHLLQRVGDVVGDALLHRPVLLGLLPLVLAVRADDLPDHVRLDVHAAVGEGGVAGGLVHRAHVGDAQRQGGRAGLLLGDLVLGDPGRVRHVDDIVQAGLHRQVDVTGVAGAPGRLDQVHRPAGPVGVVHHRPVERLAVAAVDDGVQ